MNTKTIGLILIVLGIILVVYTGFNYVTTEKVVDLGPIEISKDKNNFVQWSPFVGIGLLIGGLLLTFMKNKSA